MAVCALWAGLATAIQPASLLYLLYVGLSLVLGTIAATTLVWMLHAWRTPDSFAESRLPRDGCEPAHSFSLIVPARHEREVLGVTLERLIRSDHPAFEVIVVVGDDDPSTREVAERVAERHPQGVKVVVDPSRPKSKPRALNAALPHCTGTITGVFDAEDDVHPALLERVDQCFQGTDADIVQAGVQLMNFRSSWLTVHNVLEYYFWFRSRLHRHASQRFIPLGGNTVFIRTKLLRAVDGWDPDCLAEDCELGVRLSSIGARTAVFYEPELVTREECPPTLRAFVRQRTRWNQGYLQTLSKGYWRRLPLRQRALGAYILATPFGMAFAWFMIPIAIATAVTLKAPVPVTLISFLPALPMLAMLVADVVGLGEFCRAYRQRPAVRDYTRLVLGLPLYQGVLTFSAARAVAREIRGVRGWEKTAHLGLHLAPDTHAEGARLAGWRYGPLRWAPALAAAARAVLRPRAVPSRQDPVSPARRRPGLVAYALAPSHVSSDYAGALSRGPAAASPGTAGYSGGWPDNVAGTAGGVDGNGTSHSTNWALPTVPGGGAPSANGAAAPSAAPRLRADPPSLSPPGSQPAGLASAARWLRSAHGLLRRAVTSRADLVLQIALLAVIGTVVGTNLLHWPAAQFDEGTYISDAWAVQYGRLAPYTYSYGHPPLAWLFIALWTWVNGLFGHGSYSIGTGRELMLVVDLVSCSLLYALARRLGFGRVAASAAVLLFGLSPLAVFFHRAVLLDNPSIAWVLAAFLLAWTPRQRLWAFTASGACFAASVLCKETTLDLLPALLFAVAQNADRRTRRYCVTLFLSSFALLGGFYPLYAALKGELLPGPGHVSLVGYIIVQLFTRRGTGSLFDPHSQTHAIVTAWLHLDPWLVGAALVLTPVALARRKTRSIALAYLIQVLAIFRPGYLPNMYVIGFLPFAALIVPGGAEVMWRKVHDLASRLPVWSIRSAIGALVLLALLVVAPRWEQGDQAAMTVRLDGPPRAAERWLVEHVSHTDRLIVSDQYWIYLIEHGFDHHPMRGGFFSRTVVSYWPLDYDPAVKRAFPKGWRDFNYIVVTEDMRNNLYQTPTAASAIAHSRLVVAFGRRSHQVQIRAIGGTRPGTSHPGRRTAAGTPPRPPATQPAPPTFTYTVRPGDTLSRIAAHYRVGGGWRAVYRRNTAVIGGNPGLIHPGERLVIPH